ncbi:MAG: FKBP-type peptidyl-prolyl cis-trans isomerase [Rickettsiales bacterium]|jgi:FKBP-type peptidyl-prolyl cis-trans isomerase (trigger factor)|nr:FKBP-type peptidyl-prolyl cis-trans isomerase [Rickettsiales bacterium]
MAKAVKTNKTSVWKKIILWLVGIAAIMAVLWLAFGGCGRTAKTGDLVTIDFAGFLDGVQFEGGTAENYPLELGSGTFVPGFEDQIIGMKKGEERDVALRFPDQYVPGLAGKDVIFKVTLRDIK